MKRCVIHIGMHKTGTTSIQQSFCRMLNDPTWKYADLRHYNHSYALAKILRVDLLEADIAARWGLSRRAEALDALMANLKQDGENCLLSAEWLSVADQQQLTELRDLLLTQVSDIAVVAYVRRPKSYMESAFQERLKTDPLLFDFDGLYPNYRYYLEPFDRVFGKENVQFWKFDPAGFTDQCVVQDFCRRLDIAFPTQRIKRKNESISLAATALLYTYRKYLNALNADRRFSARENILLIKRIGQLKGGKLRFASDVIEPVLKAHQDDICWMEERLGQSLQETYDYDDEAIRSEDDLLNYPPESVMWLAEQLGDKRIGERASSLTPRELAEGLLALQIQLIDDYQKNVVNGVDADSENRVMELTELVRYAIKNTADAASLPEYQALALVTEVFEQINRKIAALPEGKLIVGGLGNFRCNQIRREQDGQHKTIKRVIFHAQQKK